MNFGKRLISSRVLHRNKKMSSRETKIKTFKDLKKYFQEGSTCMIHCAIVGRSSLVSYRHHYIVLGHTWCSVCESIEIIHFSASANESSNGKVLKKEPRRGHPKWIVYY